MCNCMFCTLPMSLHILNLFTVLLCLLELGRQLSQEHEMPGTQKGGQTLPWHCPWMPFNWQQLWGRLNPGLHCDISNYCRAFIQNCLYCSFLNDPLVLRASMENWAKQYTESKHKTKTKASVNYKVEFLSLRASFLLSTCTEFVPRKWTQVCFSQVFLSRKKTKHLANE